MQCSSENLEGTYYSSEHDKTVSINKNLNYGNSNDLRIQLPKYSGFSTFFMTADIVRNNCSFEIETFYDNYGESYGGYHNYMTCSGFGSVQVDTLHLTYDLHIQKQSPPDWVVVIEIDTLLNYSLIRQ